MFESRKMDPCCPLKRLIFHYLLQVGRPRCHYPHISRALRRCDVVNGTFRLLNDLPEPLVETCTAQVRPELKPGKSAPNPILQMF